MTIQKGDKIPSVKLRRFGKDGIEETDIADYIKGRKVVVFGVPGAFTPTCSTKHLPSYIQNYDALREKGVSEIICVSVNDAHVMKHWGEAMKADGKVTMMPDGNGELTKALGLEMDGTQYGLGMRSRRFSMVVDNGVAVDVQVEKPAEYIVSSGDACLARM
jgi:peroxiredoxin